MQVDVIFDFTKVYNVDKRIDVVIGQKFSLNTDLTGEAKWFTDNDPVLAVTVSGVNASLQATALGQSTLLIMGADFGLIKELDIHVVEDTGGPATSLQPSAGQAIPK